jgi:putative ABC transport system substrate-binding protein
MRRRDFITLVGSAAAFPRAARAQQPAVPTIGFLGAESPLTSADRLRAFRQGLREVGYEEGRNVAIEYRWAQGENDRLPALAADLVGRNVAVIATAGGVPPALAAKAATTTIPIVFSTGGNPVKAGLVASLSRPGGNLTGVTNLGGELGPKRLELLHELVPAAKVFGFLINPTNPYDANTLPRDMQAAALAFGLELHVLNASAERDFDMVFAALHDLQAGGLVISPDALFAGHSKQLATLALRDAMPAIQPIREFAANGGLISYGGSLTDASRMTAVYVGRILKGEKPAELPVLQPTKFELVINLKTAKALGLAIPLTLRARADEIIE